MSLAGLNLPPSMLSGQKLSEAADINEAKSYVIGMNSTVPIFDKNEDVFYLKSTDIYGNVTSFRKFRYTEEIEKPPIDDRYITADQFNTFKEEMLNAQHSIQQSIDKLSAVPAVRTTDYSKQPKRHNTDGTDNAATQAKQ